MSRKNILFILLLFCMCASVHASFTTILDANFDNGSLTGWDTNSGTWSASAFDLNGAKLDGGSISHALTMPAGGQYQIHYTARTTTAGLNGEFNFFTDQNGITNMNGYRMVLQSGTTVFQKIVNGTPTALITSGGVSLVATHTVDINITGTTFSVYIDGTSIGSVIDNSFTNGSKVFFDTQGGASSWAFDNVIVRSNASGNVATIMILRPINEKTQVAIDGNWTVQLLNGPGAIFLNGNDSSKNVIGVKSDTNSNNIIVDDGNSSIDVYYPRSYFVLVRTTDANTVVLQPYLIPIVDGILVNLRIIDNPSNINVPNIRTTLLTNIAGSLVTVEDVITDSTGISQVVMLAKKQYDYHVTSPGYDVNYFIGTLGADSSSISTYINFTTTDSNYLPKNITFNYTPKVNTLSGTTQQFDFNIGANFTYTSVLVQAFDGNIVRVSGSSSSNPFQGNINLVLADFNSKLVNIKFTIITTDGNTTITKSYFVTSIGNGGITNLVNLNTTFNPLNYLFLLIIPIVLFVGSLGKDSFGNTDNQVFLGSILLGIVVLLLFRQYFLYIIGALLIGGIAWIWTRVNR